MNNGNLKPFNEYSKAELKAVSRKAGIRSGEARREKAQRIANEKFEGELNRAEFKEAVAFLAWTPFDKLRALDNAVKNIRYVLSLPENTPGRAEALKIIEDIGEHYKQHNLLK